VRRVEKDAVAVVEGTVGVGSITVPLGPPASRRVGIVDVVGVTGKEVDVVAAGGTGVAASSGRIVGLGDVALNEVPLGADGAVRDIGNEEKFVGGGVDGGK